MPSERWFRKNTPIPGALALIWLTYRIATARIPHWQDYVAIITIVVVLANAWLTADRLAQLEDEHGVGREEP